MISRVKFDWDFDSKPFPLIFASANPELYVFSLFVPVIQTLSASECNIIKRKNKEYCTVGTILKENIKIVEKDNRYHEKI
jgi:hypothetical protein